MRQWRQQLIDGWTDLPACDLTYNVIPDHTCGRASLYCGRVDEQQHFHEFAPFSYGCRACGRTHVCKAAGARAEESDPCIVAVNDAGDGCVTCIFSGVLVDPRYAYMASGSFNES